MQDKIYTLRALTDIWTGDAEGRPDRLITTGLLGSIRSAGTTERFGRGPRSFGNPGQTPRQAPSGPPGKLYPCRTYIEMLDLQG